VIPDDNDNDDDDNDDDDNDDEDDNDDNDDDDATFVIELVPGPSERYRCRVSVECLYDIEC